MKRLWTLFINPWVFLPVGLGFALLTWLDFAMRHCNQVIEMWPCLSFMGRSFMVLFLIVIPGNVLIRIAAGIATTTLTVNYRDGIKQN